MKQYKPIWIIGLGVLVFIVGMSGVVQSARDLLSSGTDYGEPGMQDLGFAPLAVPIQSTGQTNEAPEIIETPSEIDVAAAATQQAIDNLLPLREKPTPTPTVIPVTPERIVIPVINLDAPIVPAVMKRLLLDETIYQEWLAPHEFAVGWHTTTALLGQRGNTVLNGHHNVDGMVFKDLHLLKAGDTIELYGGSLKFTYIVVNVMILPEKGQEFKVRLENARWLLPSVDERITLITCWPATSNTHRLIVVARPSAPPVESAETTSQP